MQFLYRTHAISVQHVGLLGVAALLIVLSAAWMLNPRAAASAERLSAGLGHPTSAAAPAATAPMLTALPPKPRIIADTEAQPLPLKGHHFVAGMTATLSAPGALVATYGDVSLTGINETSLTLHAVLDTPGTYTLVLRSPAGKVSNEISFAVSSQ